jgi:hypothetical protein
MPASLHDAAALEPSFSKYLLKPKIDSPGLAIWIELRAEHLALKTTSKWH